MGMKMHPRDLAEPFEHSGDVRRRQRPTTAIPKEAVALTGRNSGFIASEPVACEKLFEGTRDWQETLRSSLAVNEKEALANPHILLSQRTQLLTPHSRPKQRGEDDGVPEPKEATVHTGIFVASPDLLDR